MNDTIHFHYKCPLCGEISEYEFPSDRLEDVENNPKALIIGICKDCGRTWIKYAHIVFGEDEHG